MKSSNIGVMLPDVSTLFPLGDEKDRLMFEFIFSEENADTACQVKTIIMGW